MVLSTHDASAPLILRLMNGSRKRLDTGPAFRKGLLTVQVYNVEAAHMTTLIACSPGFSFGNRDQRWSLLPSIASLHRNKVDANRLRIGTPALVRTETWRCQVTANKPGQPDDASPASPDISMLSPELQQQWHLSANMHLGAVKVKPRSAVKAVWQCNKCPAGQPHVWTAPVYRRARGTHCPYCSNRRVCVHNSLTTIAPEAIKYWNHSKNNKAPQQVVAGSSLRAEWKCPSCNYEWKAQIALRVRKRAGCPKCSSKNSKKQSQPTFAEGQPSELAEWDHERNKAAGFYPHEVTLGSQKPVHWICSRCPRGQPHRWTARPGHRMYGEGCVVCAGRQACLCNSLQSLVPSVAAELDVDRNGFSPSEVTAGTTKEVWWRTAKRGSWRQSVHERTVNKPKLQNLQVGE
ncbi:hypothetical protein ABBQ32_003607 [Trebouxia sp. C0010 RCD-2024]